MRAAIYARKSTDDNNKIEENKSVELQTKEAKEFAASKPTKAPVVTIA